MTRPHRFLSTLAESPHEAAVQAEFTFILAAILCALVCIVGLIAVSYCTWLQRRSLANRVSAQSSTANKGIEKKLVEEIPKFTYILAKEEKGEDCVICLVEYADGDEVRVLPQCEHSFHIECIDKWLDSHSSCPSCRQTVVINKCESCVKFPITIAGKAVLVEGKQHNGGSSSNNKLVQES